MAPEGFEVVWDGHRDHDALLPARPERTGGYSNAISVWQEDARPPRRTKRVLGAPRRSQPDRWKDPELQATVKRLTDEGWSQTMICRSEGVSERTVKLIQQGQGCRPATRRPKYLMPEFLAAVERWAGVEVGRVAEALGVKPGMIYQARRVLAGREPSA